MFPKPSRADRKKAERKVRRERSEAERDHKQAVRDEDGTCRFPFCICKQTGQPLEVGHRRHKGMGGNPTGDRSTPEGLILLCRTRHQGPKLSLHAGTLRIDPLTDRGWRGPCDWAVRSDALKLPGDTRWLRYAWEDAHGKPHPYPGARRLQVWIAEMDRSYYR